MFSIITFLYFIHLLFIIFIPTILGQYNNVSEKEICPFQNTVNLTESLKYDNGSYLYEDIIIPADKQHYYNYDVKYKNRTEFVPTHLRGCICENKPCIKLCCERDEYIVISMNEGSICEKLIPDINASWQLPIYYENGKSNVVDLFQYFTPQVGVPCTYPEAYDPDEDKYIMLAVS